MPHQIDRIIGAVEGATWAMTEPKLREMLAVIELRAVEGFEDYSTIRQAFAPRLGPEMFRSDDGHRVDVDGIRMVPLMGVLAPKMNMLTNFSGGTSMQLFTNQLNAALEDDTVKTVLILADSPGGEGGGIAEASQIIREAREGSGKRIVTFVDGLMGSAALWVGASAEFVVATKSADVGSQGVFAIHTETSKADAALGVTRTVIRAGENKNLFNSAEPLSDSALASAQKSVDTLNAMFVADMALNRNVSEQTVLNRFGQGELFTAAEARERGLIDDVFLFSEFIDRERRLNANTVSVSAGGGIQMNVSKRVKAALFANGLIESLEAEDNECAACLRTLAKFNGNKVEDMDDDAIVAMVHVGANATHLQAAELQSFVGIDAHGDEYVGQVAEPIRNAAIAEERARKAEITAIAATLRVGDTHTLAAINDNLTVEDARKKFTEIAADESGPISLVAGDASIDKLALGTTGALMGRLGREDLVQQEEREYGLSLSDASLMDIARVTLQTHGIRSSGDRRVDARSFLRIGTNGQEPIRFMTGVDGNVTKLAADDPVVNRRGQHPDALSNLMGRMLDVGYAQAPTTFQVYTKNVPDLPDFRPKTFLETAVFQELDVMGEDDMHQQLKFESAIKAMIEVVRYGNKVGLTIEMVVDDDIATFATQLETLASAAGDTVDNSCRTMLTSNPTMLDAAVMFSTARGNYIDTGGGVPSATQAKEHRRLHRLIKGFGSTRPQNRPPTTALVPAALEEDALQTFTFFGDPKVAQTDSAINTHRGTVTPTIDSMLDDFSAVQWYTFTSTQLAPIAKAHLRGSGGMRGTRTTWSDPDRGTRYVALDMTLGLTPLNFRGAVLNSGTA